MWFTLRSSAQADPELASSAIELQISTSRTLILLTSGTYLAWYFLATEDLPANLVISFFGVVLLVALTTVISLWLLPRSLPAGQVVWLLGLAFAITVSVHLAQEPVIAFLFVLLPLMAMASLGWPAALLMECLVIALVGWLARSPLMPALPRTQGLVIVGGGIFAALAGWATTRTLLTATQWSLHSYQQAQMKVEEARDSRLELKQIQEDLLLANRELARLSDRLKAMHQIAEEARRAKEEFVANVSHELRTPLNMIIGFSEMITESPQVYGADLPSALLADVVAIQRNSQHLARLVDDVLDLSQVEAGRMALSKDWICLHEIVDEAVLAVRALYASKGLCLEKAIPSDLPRVFCDGTRIRQVVLNLLSNAGRFTAQGGVRIGALCAKGEVVVSVADTGPGIAPDEQLKLFEPFRQLDGSGRSGQGGSGLGLSISKQFVELHGGKMWVESQVGSGTTFHFSLPIETALRVGVTQAGDARRWFSPYQQYEARARRVKAPVPDVLPRYVVLEQGKAMERLLRRYLHGAEILSVPDSGEAFRQLKQSPARALIVNSPPGKEGASWPDQLALLPFSTPAIACWLPGLDEAAKRLAVVRYLVKPVSRVTLLATLAQVGEGVQSILLVDDEPEILQLFARMLSTAARGYRVFQATSGKRALSLLRERQPDAMLLDLVMPGMDGFEVLQAKGDDPSIREIPVVVVSSRDPVGEPIVSDALTIRRAGGLTARDLLATIQAVSDALAPSAPPDRRERPEEPAG